MGGFFEEKVEKDVPDLRHFLHSTFVSKEGE
jgi:hypothetical protein